MKKILALMVLGGFFVATACYAGDIKTEYDKKEIFSTFKTYAWMAPKKVAGVDDPATLDTVVKVAVDAQLAQKGFAIAGSASPDFLVGYHAVVEQKVEEFTLNSRYEDMSDPFYERLAPYGGREAEKRQEVYHEGALVLDIMDARTKKLVWRSSMQKRVNKSLKPEERKKRVEKGVAEMLKKFPPR